MTFLITKDQIKYFLKRRHKLSYYTLTSERINGFIKAEGSFFETCEGAPYFQCTQHTSDYTLVSTIRRFIMESEALLFEEKER